MPRGNPNVWKQQQGSSYAQLAGTSTTFENTQTLAPRRLPPVTSGDIAAVRATQPAGMPANTMPRGAGSFAMQSTWSLTTPARPTTTTTTTTSTSNAAVRAETASGGNVSRSTSGRSAGAGPSSMAAAGAGAHAPPPPGVTPRTFATETKTSYTAPPPDYRRGGSATRRPSEMPKPNYPNDWSTSKQLDYKPDTLSRLDPARAVKHRDSGRLLPQDVPPEGLAASFVSANRAQFTGRSRAEAAAVPPSGGVRTAPAGYNIITGAAPYQNNVFEHWDARDYRRHR